MTYEISDILSLVSQIHSDTAAFLKERLKAAGLPDLASSHGNILFRLSKTEKMTMKEIAQTIHRDKSTTTFLVNKLEKAGFIKRLPCENDSRVTYIKLTEAGAKYNKETEEISKLLINRCYQGFSDEEKQTLHDLLTRIGKNFETGQRV